MSGNTDVDLREFFFLDRKKGDRREEEKRGREEVFLKKRGG